MSDDTLKKQIQDKKAELERLRHRHTHKNCAHQERSAAEDVTLFARIEALQEEIAELTKRVAGSTASPS